MEMCQTCDYVRLTRPHGVLSSLVTERGRCGSSDCPWDIEVSPGQNINISLTDFALSHTGENIRLLMYDRSNTSSF